jgi:drug/metabolite transporter (DMT)-like permease
LPKSISVRTALVFACIANIIYGFSFLFTRLVLESTGPYVMLTCRFFVALVAFVPVMAVGKQLPRLRGKPWWWLLVLGIFQPILYFVGETYGVLATSASFSAIVIALIPILTIAASAVFLREAPTRGQSFFCTLSVLGVLAVTAFGGGGENHLRGVLFLLLAVGADVTFNLLSRKLSQTFTSAERTFSMFLMGFVLFFPCMLAETGGSLRPALDAFCEPKILFSLLYMGLLSSVAAFFMVNAVNARLPVTRTIVFVNVTTLVAVLAGAAFLGERLPPLTLAAGGVILIGVWGVQRFAAERPDAGAKEI